MPDQIFGDNFEDKVHDNSSSTETTCSDTKTEENSSETTDYSKGSDGIEDVMPSFEGKNI